MIAKLKSQNTMTLMKNGVYYVEKKGKPILNYLDLMGPDGNSTLFFDYLAYRLDTTGRKLDQSQKTRIIESIRKSLIDFKEGHLLCENFYDDEYWLFRPTFLLLTMGGDDRSIIDPKTLKNKYHSGSLPYYNYQRSSCTSSSTSLESYLHIEQQHFDLMADYILGRVDTAKLFEDQKMKIMENFVTPTSRKELSILATPSGTDVEFLCSWLGVLRAHEIFPEENPKVAIIINGDQEVGSGTRTAAELRHFSSLTPIGRTSQKGEPVSQLPNIDVQVTSFDARDEHANVKKTLSDENLLYQNVKELVESKTIVVFHIVHSSKTGVCVPSLDLIDRFKKEFGEKVITIIDAAQARVRGESVEDYLQRESNVIVTGSKFMGGPPFCGALLVCQRDAKTFCESSLPLPGLYSQYFDRYGIAPLVKMEQTEKSWNNWGMYMRWEVALHEMGQYDRIPSEFSNQLIAQWRLRIEEMLRSDHLDVNILNENSLLPADDSSLSHSNSIVTFEIDTSPPLSLIQLKSIHKKMTQKRTRDDIICEIGQPVQISSGETKRFALRLALGAKNVVDAYNGVSTYNFSDCLAYLMNNDKKILNKLFDLIDEELKND